MKVSHYIDRQEEHHRRGTLSDLLERFECEKDDWPEGIREKPPEGGWGIIGIQLPRPERLG